MTSAFYHAGFKSLNTDINYKLVLKSRSKENYEHLIPKKGNIQFRKTINSGMEIVHCVSEKDSKSAYHITLENHTAKSWPTYMTLEQLMQTFEFVPQDVFMAKLDGKVIASIFIIRLTKKHSVYQQWISH